MDRISSDLDAIRQELSLLAVKLTEIDLHLQMIDRKTERLVQLCLMINGQLPGDPDPE